MKNIIIDTSTIADLEIWKAAPLGNGQTNENLLSGVCPNTNEKCTIDLDLIQNDTNHNVLYKWLQDNGQYIDFSATTTNETIITSHQLVSIPTPTPTATAPAIQFSHLKAFIELTKDVEYEDDKYGHYLIPIVSNGKINFEFDETFNTTSPRFSIVLIRAIEKIFFPSQNLDEVSITFKVGPVNEEEDDKLYFVVNGPTFNGSFDVTNFPGFLPF